MKILVLVESPAKVKKISGFLNSQCDGNQYIVAATVGHIMDLNKEKTLGVDLTNNYKPDYVEHPNKSDIISNLKRLKRQCSQVWIASDLDQEGEFIGFSICEVLGIPASTTPRILFNEITKDAVLKAVGKPITLDFNLLDAQKTRRVMDRLIGFLITRAAKTVNDKLTVGRVQTIMVKLIIDREKEMNNFQKSLSFHTQGWFKSVQHDPSGKSVIDSKLNKTFNQMELANDFIKLCSNQETIFKVDNLLEKIVKKSPPSPLITSTLQSLVSRSLGISPKQVLDIAQKLYTQGVISYPRTDCPKLPDEKMTECESFIREKYGDDYFEARQFKTKDTSAQEAHSCIYPTRIEMDCLIDDTDFPWTNWDKRVYHYVWLYTVSSQMKQSETKNTKVKIALFDQVGKTISTNKFVADHNQLIFEGYLKAWGKMAVAEEDDDDNHSNGDDQNDENTKNNLLLKLKEGDIVKAGRVLSQQKASQGPSPYTESALLTQMKKLGIGRPSTYGGILASIQGESKQFVYKGNKAGSKLPIIVFDWQPTKEDKVVQSQKEVTQNAYRNRLYSTDLGIAIADFVDEYFGNVFNYDFTGNLENKMAQIEAGKLDWYKVVDDLYQAFAPRLTDFPSYRKAADGVNPARKPKRQLGEIDGQPVYAYLAKYGPVIQIGPDFEEGGTKPRYVKIPKEFHLEQVTFEDVKVLTQLPFNLGKLSDGRPAMIKKADHGLYLDTEGIAGTKSGRKRYYQLDVSLFTDFDDTLPMVMQLSKLNLSLVNALVEKVETPKDVLRQIQDIKIVNGQYGPYFIFNRTLVGIPKHHNVDLLTYDECLGFYQSKSRKKTKQSGFKKKKFTLKKK